MGKVDHVAIAAAPARLFDDAIGGRVDRLSGPSGHVDPGVHRRTAVEGIVADAEVAGERIAAHRLQRGNGKHALFKRVDLGPARKQLAKRRVAVLAHRFIRPAHRKLARSEEHTSELQSLMRISYAVFCLKKNNEKTHKIQKKQTY